MNKIYLLLLLIIICSSCLHQTDNVTLTTNPFDLEFSESLCEIIELKCIPAKDELSTDSVFIKLRMNEEKIAILQEGYEAQSNNIWSVFAIYLRPKAGSFFRRGMPIGEHPSYEGKVYEFYFDVSSDFLTNLIFEFELVHKPYLYPWETWYSWNQEVPCQ